jgi:hypothetical protein
MEKSRGYFPLFTLQYQDRWKIFHAIGLVGGKFSIYQQCYNSKGSSPDRVGNTYRAMLSG